MEFPTIKNKSVIVAKTFNNNTNEHGLIIEFYSKREYNKFMNKIGDLTTYSFNIAISNYKKNCKNIVLGFNDHKSVGDLIEIYQYFDQTYNK